jgi:hypothetical protein
MLPSAVFLHLGSLRLHTEEGYRLLVKFRVFCWVLPHLSWLLLDSHFSWCVDDVLWEAANAYIVTDFQPSYELVMAEINLSWVAAIVCYFTFLYSDRLAVACWNIFQLAPEIP